MKYSWYPSHHLLRLCETQASPKVIKRVAWVETCAFIRHLRAAGAYYTDKFSFSL